MRENHQIELRALQPEDREQFIRDNQWAFKYGALQEFGLRDGHLDEDGEIISRQTIAGAIDAGVAYRIWSGDRKVGGVVIKTLDNHGWLDLLFVSPEEHSKGIGYAAWCAIEKLYPQIDIWETCTPYFEKRNIHFYVNRCGFHIVEFFHEYHQEQHASDVMDIDEHSGEHGPDEMFRFEKLIRHSGIDR